MIHKLSIIGSGPAGWTAAIYAARAHLNPILYEGNPSQYQIPGGQLMFTTEIKNFPGFPTGISGPELINLIKKQALELNVKSVIVEIIDIDIANHPFILKTHKNEEIKTHSIIIATGAKANWLGIKNEKYLATTGGGVSACAICDGSLPIFRNKELAIVGGGDSAMEEANYLSKFASKIHLIHRRNSFRASKVMQTKTFNNNKIKIHWNTQISNIFGEKKIKAVQLINTENKKESKLEVSGLFVAIGHTPNTKFLKNKINITKNGYIITKNTHNTKTSVEGIFAAGDVIDPYYKQAITAAATGCMAALDAEKWLNEKNI